MGILIIVSVGDAPPHDYADDRWNRRLDLPELAVGAGVRIHSYLRAAREIEVNRRGASWRWSPVDSSSF